VPGSVGVWPSIVDQSTSQRCFTTDTTTTTKLSSSPATPFQTGAPPTQDYPTAVSSTPIVDITESTRRADVHGVGALMNGNALSSLQQQQQPTTCLQQIRVAADATPTTRSASCEITCILHAI